MSHIESLPVWWIAKQFKLLATSGSSLGTILRSFQTSIFQSYSWADWTLWSYEVSQFWHFDAGGCMPPPRYAQPTHSQDHQQLSEQGFGKLFYMLLVLFPKGVFFLKMFCQSGQAKKKQPFELRLNFFAVERKWAFIAILCNSVLVPSRPGLNG